MARKERNNVDYFPHAVIHGRKMFYLRSKFKNDGYAVWFMLLEQLGKSEYHYLDLEDKIQLMYLSSECMVSELVLKEIINILVDFGEFDKDLWNEESILFNEKFIDNISDAYKKRNNECISKNSLLLLLEAKGRSLTPKSIPKCIKLPLNNTVNTHSIVKDIIEDNRIENISLTLENDFSNFWNIYNKKNDSKKCKDKFMKLHRKEVEKILEVVQEYVNSTPDVQFRKNPLTWLNGKCWNDIEKNEYSPTAEKPFGKTNQI